MSEISVIILAFNEAMHIRRCIESVLPLTGRIYVVDSRSTDQTRQIAESLGAVVLENPWTNYATQFNWGLDHCPIESGWIFRLDADEYVTPGLIEEIRGKLEGLPEDVTGVSVRRRMMFMGRFIRHGTMYPREMLRLWRAGVGRCEQQWMDEHIQLSRGRTVSFRGDIVDDNLNTLTWWIAKHNSYATREALDALFRRHPAQGTVTHVESADPSQMSAQARRLRWLKHKVYYRTHPAIRTWLYFIYRYFFRLGVLDGYPGFVYHHMQGLWYRTLVDAKIAEIETVMKKDKLDLPGAVLKHWGIKL